MPQATLMFAFWMTVFSGGEIAILIASQIESDKGEPLSPALVFLFGAKWVVAFLAVGPWVRHCHVLLYFGSSTPNQMVCNVDRNGASLPPRYEPKSTLRMPHQHLRTSGGIVIVVRRFFSTASPSLYLLCVCLVSS